jgi:hypothetical protein
VYPMPPSALLHEARQLHNVSDRLDLLAEQHPLVSEALMTILGSIRHTAILLEGAGFDENGAAVGTRSSKCLICSCCAGTGF